MPKKGGRKEDTGGGDELAAENIREAGRDKIRKEVT